MIPLPATTTTGQLETVRGLYDSFAEGDVEAIRDVLDPDVGLHEPGGFAVDGAGTHHGFDEIDEKVLSRMTDERVDVSVGPERYVADGATVVALQTWSGTYLETGRSVELAGVHGFDFEDGEIVE